MNPFRQLLKSAGSHPPIGSWILSASPMVAEAMGHAGFDWALVDMEHAPADVMQVMLMLQALSSTRAVPVVRVPWNDTVMVKRVLDAGATTVMFPYVQSAEEARRAVAATRYPPQGVRGVSGLSRAARYGTAHNYLRSANGGMGVIVQLETRAALEAVEDIAAVPGVDALFIGPADLSADLGHLGELMHPQVLELMGQAVRRVRALGKHIGSLGGTPEQLAQYRAIGFDYMALSSDIGLLVRAAQTGLDALRTQEVGAHVHTLSAGTQTSDGY